MKLFVCFLFANVTVDLKLELKIASRNLPNY
jgi:hypothetical protein